MHVTEHFPLPCRVTSSLLILSSLKTAPLRYPSHFSSHSRKLPSLRQMSEQGRHLSTNESQYSVVAAHSPSHDAAAEAAEAMIETVEAIMMEVAATAEDMVLLSNMAVIKWSDA